MQRSRQADIALLTATGEYYQNLAIDEAEIQRSQETDSARWTTMAKFYQIQRGRAADALRWKAKALAESYHR